MQIRKELVEERPAHTMLTLLGLQEGNSPCTMPSKYPVRDCIFGNHLLSK